MLDDVKPKVIIATPNIGEDNTIIFNIEVYDSVRDRWKLYKVRAVRNSGKTLWDDWSYYIYNSTIMSYQLKQVWTDFNNEGCYKCFVKYILTHKVIEYLQML